MSEELIDAVVEDAPEPEPSGDDIAFRYVGKSWVQGIPARDLTRDEADGIGWERIRGIECAHDHKPLYEEV